MELLWVIGILFLVTQNVQSRNLDDFHDCGSEFKVHSAGVSPCNIPEDKKFCPLIRTKNATITISFTPNRRVDGAFSVVRGILAGISLPFPMSNPDACKGTGLTCPLEPGKKYTFAASVDVKSLYPKVDVLVKWQLREKRKKPVDGAAPKPLVCIVVNTKIVDPDDYEAMKVEPSF